MHRWKAGAPGLLPTPECPPTRLVRLHRRILQSSAAPFRPRVYHPRTGRAPSRLIQCPLNRRKVNVPIWQEPFESLRRSFEFLFGCPSEIFVRLSQAVISSTDKLTPGSQGSRKERSHESRTLNACSRRMLSSHSTRSSKSTTLNTRR